MRKLWRGWGGVVFAVVAGIMAAPVASQTGGVAERGPESGIVGRVNAGDGSPIAGADVVLDREAGSERVVVARTRTGANGAFMFSRVQPGEYELAALALGYREARTEVVVERGEPLMVELVLTTAPVTVQGIRVEGRRERARFAEEAGATVVELAAADIERLPGLAEADVLRAVEVLPGVISTSDFSASFNVRGGAADQNLILLDGVPIYNPFHLGGVFGVFNADMVDRTELLAGGFPARYGGRVSSVLNVRSDAGDGELGVDAGISLLASRATLSAGLPRNVARGLGFRAVNARVSARRSYFDVLFRPLFDFPYHLTDLQGVAQGWTERGVWTLTGYTGADVLDLRDSESFPLPLRLGWGNTVGGLGWEGTLGDVEVDGRVSSSSFGTGILFPDFDDTRIGSEIGEVRSGLDVEIPLGRATFGFGGEVARIAYENQFESGGTSFAAGRDEGWLGAPYGQLAWESSDWLLEVGARLDVWNPASARVMVEAAPRLAVKRFLGSGDAAVKIAAGRFTQAVHSLRDEEVPIGVDLWITAGDRAPMVVSDQVQAGWEQFIPGWNGSLEAYYRTFDGVVATNSAEDPNDDTDDLLIGTGRSWGVDLLIRREPDPSNRVDGWITLSFLRAARTFPDPMAADGRRVTYAPIYDRRLDVDLVLRFPLPAGIDGGLRFNYGSGLPYTRPLGSYPIYNYQIGDGLLLPQLGPGGESVQTAVVLGDRNSERYPAYHRLDISMRKSYDTEWGTLRPYLDLLNLYNRRDNVLFYFYDYSAQPATRSGISMLPFIPTLGVEVSF